MGGVGQAVVGCSGRYEDTLVRQDGVWKFLRRKTNADIYYRPKSDAPPAQ